MVFVVQSTMCSSQELLSGGASGNFDEALTALKGQRWKHVRSTLTPSFTVSKLKQVCVDRYTDNDLVYRPLPDKCVVQT